MLFVGRAGDVRNVINELGEMCATVGAIQSGVARCVDLKQFFLLSRSSRLEYPCRR